MSTRLVYRSGTLLPANSANTTRPDFGSAYTVNCYEVGGQVASASSGNTIALRAGHGLAVGDKFFKFSAGVTPSVREVDTASAAQVTMTGAETLSVAVGDILVNLGVDTGSGTPNYDASGITIYSDMDGSTALSNSLVTADATGSYEYWYAGGRVWELIRDSDGLPAGVDIVDVSGSTHRNDFVANTDADLTPSVKHGNLFLITNSGATSITDFDDAEDGQLIELHFADANTTLVDSAALVMAGGANKNFAATDVCVLRSRSGVWYEITRSEN